MTRPKTITVRMVQEAYKNTGIKPKYGEYCNPIEQCGCPLTALYLNEHPQALASYKKKKNEFRGQMFSDLVENWARKQFNSDFVCGFTTGVDNDTFSLKTNEFKRGLKEGSDVRKALFLKEKTNG